jgi:hypothetical protein
MHGESFSTAALKIKINFLLLFISCLEWKIVENMASVLEQLERRLTREL